MAEVTRHPGNVGGGSNNMLTGDDFNEMVASMLQQPTTNVSDNNEDQNDRRYRRQSDLRSQVSDLNSTDTPNGGADYPPTNQEMYASNIDPNDFIQAITNPKMPSGVKQNAIAAGLNDPEMQQEITNRVKNIIPESEAAKQQIRQNSNVIQSILGKKEDVATSMGDLAKQEILEKQLYASQRATENADFLTRYGMNISDVNQRVNTVAAQQPGLDQQMSQLRQVINKKSEMSFFDDPLEWIMNQVTVGDDVQKFNNIAGQFNQNEKFITSGAAATSAAINSNALKYTAMSNAEAQNLAQQKLLSAQKTILDLQEEAAKQGISSAKEIQSIQKETTAQLLTVDQRNISFEAMELQRKEAEARSQERIGMARDADERRRIAADEKQRIATESAERDFLVKKVFSGTGMNINSWQELQKQVGKGKERALQIWDSYDEDKGYSKVGATPVDVLNNLKIAKSTVFQNEAQAKMGAAISKFARDAETDTQSGIREGMKPEDRAIKLNEYVTKKIENWQDNPSIIGPLQRDGVQWKGFNTQPLVDIAAQPSMGGNKFAMEVNKLAASLPAGVEITPAMVMTSLAKQDDLNKAAKDISDFYKSAVDNNNKLLKMDRFALPDQKTFKIPLPAGLFGGDKMYDMASVSGAYNALTQLQRKAVISEAQPTINFGNFQ